MAQKTMIDGTAYGISGGKSMVDGTVYSIAKGRTMVDGTGYDIPFGSSTIVVNITGSGSSMFCYVKINDVSYYQATSLEIERGTTISLTARGTSTGATRSKIYLNGKLVASASSSNPAATYDFTPGDDISTVDIAMESRNSGLYYYIKITTS